MASLDLGGGQSLPLSIAGNTWFVTIPLPAGIESQRTLTITALDASGMTSMSMVVISIDTLGPRLSLTQPQSTTAVGTTALLAGTAIDPATPLAVSVDVGGDAGVQAATVDGGAWQRTVGFPSGFDRVIRAVTLSAVDALGNSTSTTANVLVDTQGPTLTLLSPASGVAVTSPATLSGTATDPSGPVTGLTIDFGTGPSSVALTGTTWTSNATFPPNLNRVLRPVSLQAADALGNMTQTTVQVMVDTQGPVLSATWAPAAPRTVSFGGADFRDPTEVAGGSALFRRHDNLAVTVQSPSADLAPATVEVVVGGSRVSASTGSACGSDGGFCRTVSVSLSTPPLPGLRGSMAVQALGADLLGNPTTLDAGTVTVSRWGFQYDGGSPLNGFSVSSAGELIIPHAGHSQIYVLRADGTRLISWGTRYPSAIYVAVGQVSERTLGRFIYAFERGAADATYGEAFRLDSMIASPVQWTNDATRASSSALGPVLRVDPTNGEEEVAMLYRAPNGKPAAVWAALVRASGAAQFGTRVATPSSLNIGATIQSVVATGGVITATDGASLFSFGGSQPINLLFLEERGVPFLQTPGSFIAVQNLIGLPSNEVMGVGRAASLAYGFFSATFPSTFTPSFAQFSELVSSPLSKGGVVYLVATDTSTYVGRLCRTTLLASVHTCTVDPGESIQNAIALGEGDTLYDIALRPPSQQALLQVRSASTLQLRWESPLPGTVGQCLGLTPTCINGVPVVGCVDLQGRIIFLQTDARGIDTTAEWPMLGHDPGTTWNQTTPLTPFACP
ncbi:MAG: hypothetical protein JNJ54_05360 [Myxococcaceae bacterium]|nr:hypothetical protein [Myxococcaceae bacterium]